MTNNKPTVSLQSYIRSGAVQGRIETLLGNRTSEFTTSLMSLVNSNPVLQDCPPESIIKAAITSASMNLPINPNLGFAYIIPYNNKKKTKIVDKETGKVTWKEDWITEAQFQMGYKGFIQLAQRSGMFKRINATDLREGELLGVDRLSGELNLKWEDNEEARNKLEVIGFIGYFKLLNGFEKELYMSVEDLKKHAKKYSKNYAKYGTGLWKDQFEVMAKKTVLKLLISKYGALTTNLQEALLADQSVVEEDGYSYVDNEKNSGGVDPAKPGGDSSVELKVDTETGEVVGDPKKLKPSKVDSAKPSKRKEVAKRIDLNEGGK